MQSRQSLAGVETMSGVQSMFIAFMAISFIAMMTACILLIKNLAYEMEKEKKKNGHEQ